MIRIETKNEDEEGFDIDTHVEGTARVVLNQMVVILDKLYEASPEIFATAFLHSKYNETFETVFLHSQYTKDHIEIEVT